MSTFSGEQDNQREKRDLSIEPQTLADMTRPQQVALAARYVTDIFSNLNHIIYGVNTMNKGFIQPWNDETWKKGYTWFRDANDGERLSTVVKEIVSYLHYNGDLILGRHQWNSYGSANLLRTFVFRPFCEARYFSSEYRHNGLPLSLKESLSVYVADPEKQIKILTQLEEFIDNPLGRKKAPNMTVQAFKALLEKDMYEITPFFYIEKFMSILLEEDINEVSNVNFRDLSQPTR